MQYLHLLNLIIKAKQRIIIIQSCQAAFIYTHDFNPSKNNLQYY